MLGIARMCRFSSRKLQNSSIFFNISCSSRITFSNSTSFSYIHSLRSQTFFLSTSNPCSRRPYLNVINFLRTAYLRTTSGSMSMYPGIHPFQSRRSTRSNFKTYKNLPWRYNSFESEQFTQLYPQSHRLNKKRPLSNLVCMYYPPTSPPWISRGQTIDSRNINWRCWFRWRNRFFITID